MEVFDLASYGPTSILQPQCIVYAEASSRYLPIRFNHNGDRYTYLNDVLQKEENYDSRVDDEVCSTKLHASITVNELVLLSQKVLGLKVNEIAKIVGVSRATLDLHRKGSNAKDMAKYQKTFEFVKNIESLYGDSIALGIRNILVDKKTLLQHFIDNIDNLEHAIVYVHEISTKVMHLKTAQVKYDENKLYSRTSAIGRLA